jgi:hypothetical protein
MFKTLASKTDRKRYLFYAEACDYFYSDYQETDNMIHRVYREVYKTTGKGEEIWLKLNSYMLDMEFDHKAYKGEINAYVKSLVENDPNA